MMRWKLIAGLGASLIGIVVSASLVYADSLPPVNSIAINFAPITSTTSSNYDWSTGELTAGTASASVFSTVNRVQNTVSDPTPPDPNGYGTFVGTARPVKSPTGGGAVLFEQSVCASFPLFTCLSDGSFTYGYMFLYNMRSRTLDQLNNLQTMYYRETQSNCFGGGSPRFSIVMSDGSEVHVYFGVYPEFGDCPPSNVWQSTGQLATDAAGLRWDTSQQCPGTFYNTYSGAVACVDALGLTISAVVVATDGGWSTGNQTFLYQQIQVNDVTRFP